MSTPVVTMYADPAAHRAQQWRQMPAGRALNAIVHRYVMNDIARGDAPGYTTDMRHAWRVHLAMCQRFEWLARYLDAIEAETADLLGMDRVQWPDALAMLADRTPLMFCRAALRVMETTGALEADDRVRNADRRTEPHHRYPASTWTEARRDYESGMSMLHIARRMGCAYRTITKRKKQEGWTR